MYGLLSGSSDTRQVRLRSRRPFVPAARNLLNKLDRLGISASEWTNHKWKTENRENASSLRVFVLGTGARPIGMGLPEQLGLSSTACGLVLYLFVGPADRFHLSMHKLGLASSLICECGASEQIADHILTAFLIHRAPHGAQGLTVFLTKLDAGLITSLPASDSGSAALWESKKINPRPQSCLCLTWSGYPSNDDDKQPTPKLVFILFFKVLDVKLCITFLHFIEHLATTLSPWQITKGQF